MIVSSDIVTRYQWSGAAESFEITFETKIELGKAKYVRVSWVDDVGNTFVGTEGVHYTIHRSTVTMNALSNPDPGGYVLVLERDTSITQEVELMKNGVTDLKVIERIADKLTMISQEISAIGQRSLQRPGSDENQWTTLPPEASRAGRFLAFDSQGRPLAAAGITGVPTTAWALELLASQSGAEAWEYLSPLQLPLVTYSEKVIDLTWDSETQSINLSEALIYTISLESDVTTLSFTGAPAGRATSFTIKIHQDDDHEITWPASVQWADDGIIPYIGASGKEYILTFMTFNGSSWYGFLAGGDFE